VTACVVDTNVLVVANQKNHEAGKQCRLDCTSKLNELMKNGVVVLDKAGEILNEYKGAVSNSGRPLGSGREFIIHLYNHQGNPRRCELVPLTRNSNRGYEEFPDDEKLRAFDPDDRKFVAVAIASQWNPPICHATDEGWWIYEAALRQYGVIIDHLCPEQAPPGFGEGGANRP